MDINFVKDFYHCSSQGVFEMLDLCGGLYSLSAHVAERKSKSIFSYGVTNLYVERYIIILFYYIYNISSQYFPEKGFPWVPRVSALQSMHDQ